MEDGSRDLTAEAARVKQDATVELDALRRDRGLPEPSNVELWPRFDRSGNRVDGDWHLHVRLKTSADAQPWAEALGVTPFETEGIIGEPDGSWLVYRRVVADVPRWRPRMTLEVGWSDTRYAFSGERDAQTVGAGS